MIEYLITHHRWALCVFCLLPMSLCFDIYLGLCRAYSWLTIKKAPLKHNKRVAKITQQMKVWQEGGCSKKLCTSRPGWKTMSLRIGKYKDTYCLVDINLNEILKVDEEERIVTVEPMVTMGQLTNCLISIGWTLPVVPELDDLTVGGLIAGCGVEASSHIYGLFQHICSAFEVVLADGSVRKCSKDHNPELFYNIPWSHGTLGFLVSADIQIIPCKPFVHLKYIPFHDKSSFLDHFDKAIRAQKPDDFVEALAYGSDQYVLMLGNMTEHFDASKVNHIGRFWKPWFYTHVKKFLGGSQCPPEESSHEEYIPLRHYYHRHTRSLFWELQDIIPFGNHPLCRLTLGWMMPPKPSLLKLTQTDALRKLYEQHHVVQDMLVPARNLSAALEAFDKDFLVYPLWLCPMKILSNPTDQSTQAGNQITGLVKALPDGDEMFVDVGAYGVPMVDGFSAKQACRRVEEFVRSVSGYQMLYADSYMTRKEFREMFDHSTYDMLREKLPLCKKAFPEIYDKVSKKSRI